jgi:hypothetical protein
LKGLKKEIYGVNGRVVEGFYVMILVVIIFGVEIKK